MFLIMVSLLILSATQAQETQANDSDTNHVYTKVEVISDYKKGRPAFLRYLQTHMRYPEEARKQNITGTVTVTFIVTQYGTVSKVEAVSGPQLLRAEAVRLIKESGEWTPLMACGRYAKSFHTEQVTFKL
jgi:protein TonB